MRITAVVALFTDLPEAELTSWVARGWVQPDRAGPGQDGPTGDDPNQGSLSWEFHEIDVARVRLIHDLHRGMEIGEETMPLVLSLLDQVYTLRGTLHDLARALDEQPDDVRTAMLAALRRR
jgi:chaperone modulatory protein CbpM